MKLGLRTLNKEVNRRTHIMNDEQLEALVNVIANLVYDRANNEEKSKEGIKFAVKLLRETYTSQ